MTNFFCSELKSFNNNLFFKCIYPLPAFSFQSLKEAFLYSPSILFRKYRFNLIQRNLWNVSKVKFADTVTMDINRMLKGLLCYNAHY